MEDMDITVEELETQFRRAVRCDSVILPAHQLTSLLNLALCATATYSSLTIKRLQKMIGEEVKLTGDEIRLVLDLALQAKFSEK